MNAQTDLYAQFDGAAYVKEFDQERLTGQLKEIYLLMKDGKWRSVQEISKITNFPEASVSAQLRNLRKPKHGGFNVESKRFTDNGFFKYRILL